MPAIPLALAAFSPAPELDLAPARAVLAGLDAAAVAARSHGLTLGQLVALHHVVTAKAPPNMGELAASFGCSSANVTQIVDGLEARGLVERIYPRNDRRAVRVVATGKGGEVGEAITDTLAVLLAMES